LIAEDDEFLGSIYETKFTAEGFKVIRAIDGEEAIKFASSKKPDLILLDVLMPKLDGFGVLKILKEQLETRGIPVILLTNLGQRVDVEKGLSLGAVDYLIKTHLKPSETVAKVRKILSEIRAASGASQGEEVTQ